MPERTARGLRAGLRFHPMRDATAEAEFVERARSGDGEAFDRLVRLHFPRVYALLFRLVGNHEDAEDLAQEAFIKAQASLRFFRGDSAFSTWLFRIAVHLSRDHFRSARRRDRALPLPGETGEPTARGEGPADAVAQRELMSGMSQCVERLPHRQRIALVLRTSEGLDYEEISEVLGITPQTARLNVMKARRRLERWMKPWIGRGES